MKSISHLSLLLLFCLPSLQAQTDPQTSSAREGLAIRPSTTDAAIKDFDEPHWVYVNRDIVLRKEASLPADRHELLLWLPGTRPPGMAAPPPGPPRAGASDAFCELAADLGYHVIALTYPNALSAAKCRNDPEPTAFEDFRLALIAGGASKHVTVQRVDSIENRLIKLLQWLAEKRAREGWSQFLTQDGTIRWPRVAVVGQSQGGGHAALIGIHHEVSRVVCFGSPKDYSLALKASAAWYQKQSATPKDRFYAFNHEQDYQGCTPAQQIENLKALKLDVYGPPVKVEDSSPPFSGSHILMTNHPGTKVDSRTAHGTMITGRNRTLFREVWRYLLLHPSP